MVPLGVLPAEGEVEGLDIELPSPPLERPSAPVLSIDEPGNPEGLGGIADDPVEEEPMDEEPADEEGS